MKHLIFILLFLFVASQSQADSLKIDHSMNLIADGSIKDGVESDDNFDTELSIHARAWIAQHRGLIDIDSTWVDSIGSGKVITSAVCSVYCVNTIGSDSISCYGVWKNKTDITTCTWNDWDAPDLEWGTAGCANTNDAGSFNTTDGGGDDREATAWDSFLMGSTSTWYGFDLDTSWINDCYSNNRNITICFNAADANWKQFSSTDATTAADRPYFIFWYEDASKPRVIFINTD
jgi:hypothetical protein